ncbi:MAG: penicillin-binding protein 2 [Kiritimatiellaeota bacterium]|nr:penicillin-binding protein 2 [Kiritimatiellota bacterium]
MEHYAGERLTDGWRMALLAAAFGAAVVFLARALHQVQVVQTSDFTRDQARQSIRRVQVPGPRGRIFDRNGVCLAENRASYCIAYYVEELQQRGRWVNTINAVNEDIDRLAAALGIPRAISHAAVSNHVIRSLPMPLLAWRDVDEVTLARWAERAEEFRGVDVYVQPERSYPQGALAAHALGYVRRDRPQKRAGGGPDPVLVERFGTNSIERAHFYLPEMLGVEGVERVYNDLLMGRLGEQLIRVDARGYKHATWQGREAEAGGDLRLTLDVRVQLALERALQGLRGAGVVVDPRNGEVLAMASAPAFDPNDFLPRIPPDLWARLNEDEAVPLFNRAVQGRYAPGSTFKPVTAMAALAHPGFSPADEYVCHGAFEMGSMRLRCWNTYGHGGVALRKAIEQSCNCYFCNIGNAIGYGAIYEQARQLGLGARLGIDLPAENPGLLPTDAWKRQARRDRWRPGDTCQIAIGQGMLVTTPLQMAVLTATIANGGTLYRPHLVRPEGGPEVIRTIAWAPAAVAAVHEGMRDVAAQGTGRRVQLRGTQVSAKTGTAEVDVRGRRQKNVWVTAFAPSEAPRVAVAIVVEDGMSGGQTVAPMVREVLLAVFGEAEGGAEAVPPEQVRGD